MENKPVCYDVRGDIPEVYSGVPTFLGLPYVTEDEMAGQDVIIMGAPWEGICTMGAYTGCELATKTIRSASIRYGGYLPEFDYDAFDYISAGDCGDAAHFPGDCAATFASIEKKADAIFSRNKRSLCFGGDHSITIPMLRSLAKNFPGRQIGVVHFDAHLDNMPSFIDREPLARCCPMHRAYEMEEVTNIVHVGIRGPRNNFRGLEHARKHNATVVSSFEVQQKGIDAVFDIIKENVLSKSDIVYLTICSDALDVSENPGGPPDFAGLTSYQLLSLVHKIAAEGIQGLDFVEVYPPQDHAGISSHMAAWAGIYGMSGIAKWKISKGN